MFQKIIYFLFVGLFLFSCKNKNSETNHADEIQGLSYTIFTDKAELFVEFKPLIVGDSIKFGAHVTNLNDYKPLGEGTVTVSIAGASGQANVSKTKGIFNPKLKPEKAGKFQLVFEVNSPNLTDKFVIDSITIYPDLETAKKQLADFKPVVGSIRFLKEQAWKIDFGVKKTQRQIFSEVIKTSGQILPAQGDEITIAATSNGIVMFNSTKIIPGQQVNQGLHLFTISGSNLTDGNPDVKFADAKALYEKAKNDFDRAQTLAKDKIVPEKELQEIEYKYKQAKVNYETLLKNYSSGGKLLNSPISGYIKNVYIKEGQYVEIGQPIATISQNRKLIIRADVAQNHWNSLSMIKTANFKTAYDNHVYSLDSLNGKFISYGKSSDNSAFYAPVFFEFDNKGSIISGSFIEVFLISKPLDNTIVVPVTALIEEQGNYYVYVEITGESFEKREVKTGISNGFEIQVISGIKPNEYVVVTGAYQVKLASMSGALPAGHGHEH